MSLAGFWQGCFIRRGKGFERNRWSLGEERGVQREGTVKQKQPSVRFPQGRPFTAELQWHDLPGSKEALQQTFQQRFGVWPHNKTLWWHWLDGLGVEWWMIRNSVVFPLFDHWNMCYVDLFMHFVKRHLPRIAQAKPRASVWCFGFSILDFCWQKNKNRVRIYLIWLKMT